MYALGAPVCKNVARTLPIGLSIYGPYSMMLPTERAVLREAACRHYQVLHCSQVLGNVGPLDKSPRLFQEHRGAINKQRWFPFLVSLFLKESRDIIMCSTTQQVACAGQAGFRARWLSLQLCQAGSAFPSAGCRACLWWSAEVYP